MESSTGTIRAMCLEDVIKFLRQNKALEQLEDKFRVLRARNLVGKLKGKTSAKITDVFVTISLGKEKFQTSTIKYGAKLANSVEWFEECDLSIPSMEAEVNVHVMNRGLLSDEFIGYVSVPLHKYSVYDRPTSQWLPLIQKPSKLPDGRCRGEVEVRLTFHVKSRTEEISPGSLKGKRAGSIKSLVSAVGDKFKFTRTRSLRGDGRQQFSSPQPPKSPMRTPTNPASFSGRSSAHQTNSVNFEAVDVYVPEQCWRDNEIGDDLGDGNFARSYSLTTDKRKYHQDFKSRSLMNLPTEPSFTLPLPRRRERPSLDDSAIAHRPVSPRSSRSSRSSVTSQEGYLENIFKKECEVGDRMAEYSSNIEEESEEEYDTPRRRSAQEYHESSEKSSASDSSSQSGSSSESEGEDLPKVRLKEKSDSVQSVGSAYQNDSAVEEEEDHKTKGDNSGDIEDSSNRSDHESESDNFPDTRQYTSELDRVIARENSRHKFDSLNSQGSSEEHESSHASSSSIGYHGKSAAERAFDRGSTDSLPESSRRRISPQQDFSFSGIQQNMSSDDKPMRRRPKPYIKNGRRYTIQGLEGFSSHHSAPDIRDRRPSLQREDSVPEDLMAIYRNMTREELVRLVVTHKAQIIRKDNYIKDLENYIDSLLVRVMENTPRILQNL